MIDLLFLTVLIGVPAAIGWVVGGATAAGLNGRWPGWLAAITGGSMPAAGIALATMALLRLSDDGPPVAWHAARHADHMGSIALAMLGTAAAVPAWIAGLAAAVIAVRR